MSSNTYQDLMINIIENLIDAGTDHFFDVLRKTLGDVARFYDVDRTSIMIYDASMSSMKPSVEWNNVGIMPRIPTMKINNLSDQCPWLKYHQQNEIYIINDIHDLHDQESITFFNHVLSKTAAMIPLYHENACFGFLLLEHVRTLHDWSNMDRRGWNLLKKVYEDAFYRQQLMTTSHRALSHVPRNFLQNMSHEMKTPLGGIHHALYLLTTTPLTDEQKSYVNLGQEASDGLNTLIDHMLDMTPYDTEMKLDTYAFNLEEEILRIYRSIKRALEKKGIEFFLDFDYRIRYEMLGDVVKLRQILTHLMDNAIKFTDDGSITCHVILSSEDPLMVSIQIKDTGIGIPQEHMNRLYDPFFQGDMSLNRLHQGAGLGLPVVKKLIDVMNGKIIVESQIHQGSTFSIHIPLLKGNPMDFASVQHHHVLWMSEHYEHNALIDAFISMGMTIYHKDKISDQKVDLVFIDQKIKSTDEIDQLKDEYGTPRCLVVVLDYPILKQSKKIDIFLESPFSRHALMHKLIHIEHERIKEKEDTSYGTLLYGTAMVVDDNRLNRIALESILVKEGIDVILAESGEKAIDLIKKEAIDLILMDIQMPIMDGIETTRRIRSLGKQYEKISIVAVTANAYFNDYDMLKSAKINDVIYKPIHIEQLKQILRKYMKIHDVLHIPDDLFVWDEQDFHKRFEGSESIATEVLQMFVKEYSKDIKRIEHAVKSKNREEIVQAVHYFKGSCAYVSGKRAVWVLNKMLEEVKRDFLIHMDDNLHILCEEINDLTNHLKGIIK